MGFVFPEYEDTMLLHYCLEEAVGTHGLKPLALRFTDLGDYERELDEYKKIFSENKEEVENYLVEEGGYTNIENRKDQVSKNIHSIEFLKKIDKDMSNISFLKSLTTDAFFDIFSVRISKSSLRKKIVSDLPESILNHILQDKDDFSNSYSYTIQTKIY